MCESKACPASWNAIILFSSSEIILLFFSGPAITLSIAFSTSNILIFFLLCLAASKDDSLKIFARSAPVKPGVCLAIVFKFTSLSSGLPLAWISRIFSLPIKSGLSTTICLSNLPGLSSAGSSMSGLFVAAIRITVLSTSKPSISTRS